MGKETQQIGGKIVRERGPRHGVRWPDTGAPPPPPCPGVYSAALQTSEHCPLKLFLKRTNVIKHLLCH